MGTPHGVYYIQPSLALDHSQCRCWCSIYAHEPRYLSLWPHSSNWNYTTLKQRGGYDERSICTKLGVWRAVWGETFTHGSVRGWGWNSLALLDLSRSAGDGTQSEKNSKRKVSDYHRSEEGLWWINMHHNYAFLWVLLLVQGNEIRFYRGKILKSIENVISNNDFLAICLFFF